MSEFHGKSETHEIQQSLAEKFKEIKPAIETTLSEAKSFVKELFGLNDGHYTSYSDRLKQTPSEQKDRGRWEGERGESKFIPSGDSVEGQAAKEKLAEKGLDGIRYKDAEPDLSKCAETTVQIDHMTENRHDYEDNDKKYQQGNFTQADIKCAEQWNKSAKDGKTDWTARDIANWRDKNKYSWHERCDMKTMDLVPREIHEYFTHSGGVAECKARDKTNSGGGFDE